MTPEKQRIAIAEACGWTRNGHLSWFHPTHGQQTSKDWDSPEKALPDYLTDLNAIHEAEKLLTDIEFIRYFRFIEVMHPEWIKEKTLIHATAADRAEAFLRTIGKWEES
jgi:hypothetical protein